MILTKSSTYRLLPTAYRLTFVKAMLSSVDAVELLRLSEKASPPLARLETARGSTWRT